MQDFDLSDPSSRIAFEQAVLAAVRRAVREAMLRSKKLGHKIVDWRDGQSVWIEPEDIVVTEDEP